MNHKLKRVAEIDDAVYNSDGVEDDDDDIPENVHNRLLGAVSKMYKKKRVDAPTRKEPTLEVSEFHLTSARDRKKKNGVNVSSLTKVLDKKATHKDIKQQMSRAKNNSKRLDKPVERLEADKVERAVGYENLKKDLGKWNAIVHHHRAAEQVSFPLPKSQEIHTWDDSTVLLSKFRTPTLLEQQTAEILKASREYRNEVVDDDNKVDKEPPIPLTLKEMMEQRALMARTRAQRRYKETKAARQNRIKSKKFHRIQRKEKIKAELKEFEDLQKKDPEAALKKLDQLEKARAQERASLRHRTTGHWAKSLQVRAKYDKEARIALAEQLQKSRELTRRLKQDSSSDEEFGENNDSDIEENPTNTNNNSETVKTSKLDFDDMFYKIEDKPTEKVGKKVKKLKKQVDSSSDLLPKKGKNNRVNNVEDDLGAGFAMKKRVVRSDIEENPTNKNNNSETVETSKLDFDDMFYKIEDKPTEKVGKKVKKLKKQVDSSSDLLPKKGKNNRVNNVEDDLGAGFAMKKRVVRSDIEENPTNKNNNSVTVETSKLDFDDMFYKIEDKLTEKVGKKVEKLKKQVDSSSDLLPKKGKNNNRVSNVEDDLGAGFAMKKRVVRSDIDEALDETTNKDSTVKSSIGRWSVEKVVLPVDVEDSEVKPQEKPQTTDIEPVRTLQVKPKFLKTVVPTDLAGREDLDDDDDDDDETNAVIGEGPTHNMTIAEAFADDDVVREFQSEKEDEIKKSKIDDVNLVLPGWGSWGGHAIKENKRKKERFIVRFPTVLPRRDENKGNVVINEDNDAPVKPLLVSEVPFPFTSVKDFEASIRAPIGSTFLPQKAFRKLTAPTIKTKMGTIIEPMSGDNIVKNMKT